LYCPEGVIGNVWGLLRVIFKPYAYLGSDGFTAVTVVPAAIFALRNAVRLTVSEVFNADDARVMDAPTAGTH
jgi:hypothetical protein